jgi:hypothetical protein
MKRNVEPILHLNYKIDKSSLLAEAENIKHKAVGYTDSRYPDLKMDDWLIGYHSSDYVEQIMRDFGIKGKPRFYWLQPFAVIPEHVDNGTLCGLNFILTEGASPISFGDQDYYYESILIDTTKPHSVKNNENERIMFKISIFDETFEQVAEKIKKYLK